MRTPSVVAIGAANIDINGYSASALLHEESNPGRVELCAGGVARNIAENLARLGVEVELLTALGGDGLQRLIIESCRAAGVGYSYCAVDVTCPPRFTWPYWTAREKWMLPCATCRWPTSC